MKRLQLEFFLRAAKIVSICSTIWFFWWAVIWQVIWWQPPFSQSNYPDSLINTLGFVLSLLWWIIMDLLLAHPELLAQIALPKWHRKAAPKTTEKKEDERQPIY